MSFSRRKTGATLWPTPLTISAVRHALGNGIVMSVDAVFLTTAILVMMVRTISWKLTVLALLPLLPMVAIVIGFGRVIHARFRAVQEALCRAHRPHPGELLRHQGGKGICPGKGGDRTLCRSERTQRSHEYAPSQDLGAVLATRELPGVAQLTIVLGYGGILVINRAISLGDFVAFNSYLGMLTWPVMAIGWVMNMIQRGRASMDRINDILSEVPE